MGDALLPGDPPDEHHDRPVRVDAVPLEHVPVGDRAVQLGVDAVVDHVHPARVDERVGGEHLVAHAALTAIDRGGAS